MNEPPPVNTFLQVISQGGGPIIHGRAQTTRPPIVPPFPPRYGRRFVLLLSIALQTVFGVAVAFSPNFYVYVTLRFAVGTTISGVIINAFVLGTHQGSHSDMKAGGHYVPFTLH